jgi:hypothetical protein
VPALREIAGEAVKATVQERNARRADARAPEQPLVEHEQRGDLARTRRGRRERRVVREAQVAAKPVKGAHARSVAAHACQR